MLKKRNVAWLLLTLYVVTLCSGCSLLPKEVTLEDLTAEDLQFVEDYCQKELNDWRRETSSIQLLHLTPTCGGPWRVDFDELKIDNIEISKKGAEEFDDGESRTIMLYVSMRLYCPNEGKKITAYSKIWLENPQKVAGELTAEKIDWDAIMFRDYPQHCTLRLYQQVY